MGATLMEIAGAVSTLMTGGAEENLLATVLRLADKMDLFKLRNMTLKTELNQTNNFFVLAR